MHTHHDAMIAALEGDPSAALAQMGCAGEARALLDSADEQGVRPLLVDRLLDLPGNALDPTLRTALKDRALREAAQALHRQRELSRCIQLLARAGVPCVVFKGAATAHALYSRPALRPMDDADLLMDPRYRTLAVDLLSITGYSVVPANDRNEALSQTLFRRHDSHGLLHNLDVHWRLSNRPWPDAAAELYAPLALRARSVPLPALGDGALQPDAVDSLVIACTHLAGHHAGALRLIWLYEIREMLQRLDPAKRKVLQHQVGDCGLERRFAAGLRAAGQTFPGQLAGLSTLASDGDDLNRPRPRYRSWLEDLRTLSGMRARMRYLAAHAFPAEAFMRSRTGNLRRPLTWLYLRRALRGVRHLFGT